MQINLKVLGGGLLSTGPLLIQFGGAQAAWWIGVCCVVVGPLMMAVETKPQKAKRKSKIKP